MRRERASSQRRSGQDPVPVSIPHPSLKQPCSTLRLVLSPARTSPPSLPLPAMATAAGRKKSLVTSLPPSIDSPVANNTLLNKAASQSTSLYQQCSSLRNRLMHLQDFSDWFSVAALPDSSRRSTDPVTQLWDVFALGVPLCYLFNILPSAPSPIAVNTDVRSFDPNNERTKKHAIALFSMNVKQVPGCEGFTVRDLWDRSSTDGFVKVSSQSPAIVCWTDATFPQVVSNVINLVQQLPEDLFLTSTPSSPTLVSLGSTESLTSDNTTSVVVESGGARANIIKELVDTERKYVQDLEVMQVRPSSSSSRMAGRDSPHRPLFRNTATKLCRALTATRFICFSPA